jgi:hypothetical protein
MKIIHLQVACALPPEHAHCPPKHTRCQPVRRARRRRGHNRWARRQLLPRLRTDVDLPCPKRCPQCQPTRRARRRRGHSRWPRPQLLPGLRRDVDPSGRRRFHRPWRLKIRIGSTLNSCRRPPFARLVLCWLTW